MAGGCDARGCDRTFGPRFARHVARRYRSRGLDKTVQRMVDLITECGVAGADVLEIGGGVGELGIELLKRGARHVTSLELSAGYDDEARALLAEAGLAGQVDRRIIDIAAYPDDVEAADLVVLHRVVCCYPDYARLLSAAAGHARAFLVFSYPPRNLLSRSAAGVQAVIFRLLGRQYRFHVHPPKLMFGVLGEHGLRQVVGKRGTVWRLAACGRPATSSP